MNALVPWIQVAGVMHLAVLAANFALPRRLAVRENVARMSPIIGQVFLVHWLYILIVLLLFAVLCLAFPGELAGESALGRFLSGFMAGFWLLRIVLQVLYYDRATRRANVGLDAAYLAAIGYFAVIFGLAAWGGVR